MINTPSYNTRSNIKVARFVTFEDDAGLKGHNTVRAAAAATEKLIGISGQWSNDPQLPVMKEQFEAGVVGAGGTVGSGAATTYTPLAAAGTSDEAKPVRVHDNQGEPCGLILGGTVNPGDLLTSDADGAGVVAATTNFYGARALQAGVAGEQIDVVPVFGQLD